jgi:PAS domain S-box-containing protein
MAPESVGMPKYESTAPGMRYLPWIGSHRSLFRPLGGVNLQIANADGAAPLLASVAAMPDRVVGSLKPAIYSRLFRRQVLKRKRGTMSEKPSYEELEQRVAALEEVEVELKRTETSLKDEVNWRRLLTNESRDGIVVVDRGAKVYEANDRFAHMLGYTGAELHRLHVWDWDALLAKEQIMEMAKTVDDAGHHFETQHRRRDGKLIDVGLSSNGATYKGRKLIFCICRDISRRKQAEKERGVLIKTLRESMPDSETLRGILPLCSFCKKVRDDKGHWESVDLYLTRHTGADISHSICPECLKTNYPDEHNIYQEGNQTD